MNKPRSRGGDEELGSIGVSASIGHAEKTDLGVLQLEVLISELVAVDCHLLVPHPHMQLRVYLLDLPPVPSPLVKSPPNN